MDGDYDCFITKFAINGQSLVYSTFLGGSGWEKGFGIAVEDAYAYVIGSAASDDFAVVDAFNSTYGEGADSFVTKVASDGQSLVYSTFLGAVYAEQAYAIAVENGYAYVTGVTDSTAFPIVNAYNSTHGGMNDCFVSVLVDEEDGDSDGLSNWKEDFVYGTDSYCIDTDGDGFLDGYEVNYGSNATDATDYPAMPQAWYDAIYEDLNGNATLIQQIKDWLDGNHTAIETLFTYVEGNATLLLQTVDALEANATELGLVSALATLNYDWLSELNGTVHADFNQIREVMDMLGATIGDCDYDGLDDLDEIEYGTDIQNIDTDCDNLNDAFEVKIGTNPLDDDSDGDSYLDGIEIIAETDPLDPNDYPGAPTTSEITTTSSPSDGFSPMMLALVIGGACIGVAVVVIFILRRQRVSS